MFATLEQPKIILACLFVGVLLGVYYEPFYLLGKIFKNKLFKNILIVIYFSSFSLIFIKAGLFFNIPDFREYMLLCVLVGGLLYKVSLHKPIAFFINLVYNNFNKLFIKLKQGVKKHYERRKEKKNILGGTVGHDNAHNRFGNGNNLPNDRNIHKKKPNRKVGRRDFFIKSANR